MAQRTDIKTYFGTNFQLIDQSHIKPLPVAEPARVPFLLVVASSDKGEEGLTVNQGSEFFDRYVFDTSSMFDRHGQPLLQAANAINAGAKIWFKRVVAPDAALANVGVFAHLKKVSVQKTDADGNLLYTDATTNEETTVPDGNTPIMVNKITLYYSTKTQDQGDNDNDGNLIINDIDLIGNLMYGQGNFKDDSASADSADGLIYPIAVWTDIGRGKSNKRFTFSTDYATAKSRDHMYYTLAVIEGNTILERHSCTLHPDGMYVDNNMSVSAVINKNSKQIRCKMFGDSIVALMDKIAELLGTTAEEVEAGDILFARSKKGEKEGTVWENLIIDTDNGTSMANPYGIPLESGSNGSFGDSPLSSPDYVQEVVKVFDGTYNPDVYDLDNYKINAIIDANYPAPVKRAIEALVTFREDCVYIRDLGIGLKSTDEIISAHKNCTKNIYCSTYHNSYDIIDPYSKKQISVTICYDLAALLVEHFSNGRNRPLAGQLHNITFPNAIEGTVNFVPRIIPGLNQKEILVNERINFTNYYDGLLVMETLYTSQDAYSQLSFLNNIFAIQEVIQAVRTRCPKIRYSFLDGDDLDKYMDDVNAVLAKYQGNFKSLTMEYLEDATMVANKIFYAAISVIFRDFVQAELFKIYALPSEGVSGG